MSFVGKPDDILRGQFAIIAIEWRRIWGGDSPDARAHLLRHTGRRSRLELSVDQASDYIDRLRRM